MYARDQRMKSGRVVWFRPDQVLVQTDAVGQSWWVMYAAICIAPSAMPPPLPPERGPTHADFARGDKVSFEPQDMIARFGTII